MREMEILKGLEGGENMAVQFVDHLLALGLRKKASDIHLEPGEEQMTVRMRTDGRLKVCAAVEMRHHPMILTRVKVMADMDIAEKRLPQDGHIRASIQGKATDLRVSVIPTIHGEKAVLRFLNTDTVIDSPETFGMSEENYGKVLDILKRPNGIFYITGPTGSGKTTTLYMILERLAELPVNIVAIEDPVEKHIRGISQMQVNTQAGLTFETGLRAALRQDPDVIMVGETRDSQTLKTSVRAAVTGHLVLSTLHTNNAAGTVVRMLDMGAEPYLAASSLSGILAQRLVRKICPDCKTEREPDGEERKLLGPGIRRIRYGTGCARCGYTGYQGRTAVHEVLAVDKTHPRNDRRRLPGGGDRLLCRKYPGNEDAAGRSSAAGGPGDHNGGGAGTADLWRTEAIGSRRRSRGPAPGPWFFCPAVFRWTGRMTGNHFFITIKFGGMHGFYHAFFMDPPWTHRKGEWYTVCKTDIIPPRIWFSRTPRKSRRPIHPEGYTVCKYSKFISLNTHNALASSARRSWRYYEKKENRGSSGSGRGGGCPVGALYRKGFLPGYGILCRAAG